MACLQYSSPCPDEASGSDMTAVTPLQGAPLHLVTWATRLHTHSPSLPPAPGFAGCRNALSHPRRESVVSVPSPMVCVRM